MYTYLLSLKKYRMLFLSNSNTFWYEVSVGVAATLIGAFLLWLFNSKKRKNEKVQAAELKRIEIINNLSKYYANYKNLVDQWCYNATVRLKIQRSVNLPENIRNDNYFNEKNAEYLSYEPIGVQLNSEIQSLVIKFEQVMNAYSQTDNEYFRIIFKIFSSIYYTIAEVDKGIVIDNLTLSSVYDDLKCKINNVESLMYSSELQEAVMMFEDFHNK